MILYNSSYENDSVVPALGDSDNELILEVVSDFRCCTRGAVDLERDDSDRRNQYVLEMFRMKSQNILLSSYL